MIAFLFKSKSGVYFDHDEVTIERLCQNRETSKQFPSKMSTIDTIMAVVSIVTSSTYPCI